MFLVNGVSFLFLFTVCYKVSRCDLKQYPVCSSEGWTLKCNRGDYLNFTCNNSIIHITLVFINEQPRECNENDKCGECCRRLSGARSNSNATQYVSDICNNNSSCMIDRPNDNNHSYIVYYRCMRKPLSTIVTTTPTTKTTHVIAATTNPAPTTNTLNSTTRKHTTSTETTKVTVTLTNPTKTPLYSTSVFKSTKNTKHTHTPYNPGNSSRQTESGKFPTVALAAPVAIVFILASTILAVVCIVRHRRQKNDRICGDNDQNRSNHMESVSNPAYTSDCLANKSPNPLISEERTPSFSQDSGYTECQDVDTVDANNGEYNTINFKHSTLNIDPTYNHIQKQAQIVDNTYSHVTSEQNDRQGLSNYSHMNVKPRQPKIDVNDSTYNTLQTHVINKPLKPLPFNDELSENEYNLANFTTGMSKLKDDKCENSLMNSPNKGIPGPVPPNPILRTNDVEYAKVVKDKNKQEPNEESAHTYFVLEKGNANAEKRQDELEEAGKNNSHACFVLGEDPANDKTTGGKISDSTPHDYFVLMKQ